LKKLYYNGGERMLVKQKETQRDCFPELMAGIALELKDLPSIGKFWEKVKKWLERRRARN
jgi:hypothetical protein